MVKTGYNEIPDFESLLGLPVGFYDGLLTEDDWSFVIKLSSLFEGACTRALSARINRPELEDALSHLEMGNGNYGKLKQLLLLNAISKPQFGILKKLGELRNVLVHRIANVTFQFEPYVLSLSTPDFNTFVKNFGHGLRSEINVGGRLVPKADFVKENPKLSIWSTCAEILACLYLDLEYSEIQRAKYAAEILTTHYRTMNEELAKTMHASGLPGVGQ